MTRLTDDDLAKRELSTDELGRLPLASFDERRPKLDQRHLARANLPPPPAHLDGRFGALAGLRLF